MDNTKAITKVNLKVQVRNTQQLFDYRDPAPFREKDLDDEFVEYIVSSAEEFSPRTNFKISIQIEDNSNPTLSESEIQTAFQMHFNYQADLLLKKQTKMRKMTRLFIIIGLISLALFTFLSELLANYSHGAILRFFREGLIIIGWVLLWRPIELAIFDWIPLYEKRRIYTQLAKAEVQILH